MEGRGQERDSKKAGKILNVECCWRSISDCVTLLQYPPTWNERVEFPNTPLQVVRSSTRKNLRSPLFNSIKIKAFT